MKPPGKEMWLLATLLILLAGWIGWTLSLPTMIPVKPNSMADPVELLAQIDHLKKRIKILELQRDKVATLVKGYGYNVNLDVEEPK